MPSSGEFEITVSATILHCASSRDSSTAAWTSETARWTVDSMMRS